MSDTGANELSHHNRLKSTKLSLLHRDNSKRSNGGINSSRNSASGARNTTESVGANMSDTRSHSVRGHNPRVSMSTSTSGANLAGQGSGVNTSATSPTPAAAEKSVSIEQSVRKFRVFEALRSGDTASISKAIRETVENNSGLDDTTILHLAIQCAELPVVEYVLSNGAGKIDVNARDREGNTALHVAAQQGRGTIVKMLLGQANINDSIANYQGRLPLDLARTPDIFQQLQLSRSIFVDAKVKEVQSLIVAGDYEKLGKVLEEPRVKIVIDINSGEFASDISTVQAGGTLLHEAARKKNTKLIQVLLLHGADPFRRDRRGKLPQDVTKDDLTKAMLKKSPAAVAAQRGIQEKAVLGNASQQGQVAAVGPGDSLAGRDGREMKGYLKKWTNYRKGYQLRWFVLEDGVLSYYKHQDDAGSACRGAINMRIAQLKMDPTEKQKFDILGKSSVKYHLKANHEVEAKRWFWALNNSIQWTKDQAKEEEKQKAISSELLRQAVAEQTKPKDGSGADLAPEANSETRRSSFQSSRMGASGTLSKPHNQKVAFVGPGASTAGSVVDDEDGTAFGSYEASYAGDMSRVTSNMGNMHTEGEDDDDDYGDSSSHEAPASKDAFNITAQSAKLQLDLMSQVHTALQKEQAKNPSLVLSDPSVSQAYSTYDGAIRSLKGLLGDLLKISRDRDAYWQYRLDREADMRRMWEDSMAKVAREQEVLEAKMGESEEKRKRTKKALKEAIVSSASRAASEDGDLSSSIEKIEAEDAGTAVPKTLDKKPSFRRKSILQEAANLSDTDEDLDDEFFDAIDAGELEAAPMAEEAKTTNLVVSKAGQFDISSAFRGYEDGIRKKLKMDADDRPKISLWGILKSMIGKDMTKMTLPVSFNEPTSLLQRCAEDMEYADLLDIAADRTDSTERMVYVAAFAASEYASTIGRVAKPFNPLLGETYEYARPDKNYRFFIEQVSHHPPIGAAWAESPKWTYYGESAVKSKFYGKSFDINPLGTWFLKLRPTNGQKEEIYTWKKVTSSVIGIITGSPTVDNYGPMEVKNWTTGETCVLDFKARGWKASSAYQIAGRVSDASGQPRFSVGGRWNSKLYARLTPGYEASVDEPKSGAGARPSGTSSLSSDPTQAFVVWEANARPAGIPFNLTPFVVTLNDLPARLRAHLPPTDTRLRPDQRAMEDGEYDFAATEKERVEQKQRRRRREREEKGEEYVPHWFRKARCKVTGEEFWEFNGKYWEERARNVGGEAGKGGGERWTGVEDIFTHVPGDGDVARTGTGL